MTRLARLLFVLASIAYPFIILGGLFFFKAPPRLLSLSLLVIVVLNFLANSGDARKGGFAALRFWAVSGILTGLIVLIVLTNSAGLVKFYPVLMNIFLFGGFAWTLRSGPPMIYRFAILQDKTIAYNASQAQIAAYCRSVTLVWCGFFVINGSIALVTALWASELVWSVYNGMISYGLIGILFLVELVFRHFRERSMTAYSSISRLQSASRPAGFAAFVRRDGSVRVNWGEFCQLLAAARAQIENSSHTRWIIASDDALYFSVYVLAVLQTGRDVLLPRNLTPAALAEITDGNTGLLSADLSTTGLDSGCPEIPLIDPDQARVFLYTSGSTGEPKEVRKSFRQIEAEIANLHGLWGAECQGRSIHTTVQHHHFYGLLFYILFPLAEGLPMCTDMINYPEHVQDLQEQAVAIVGSPAFYKRFVETSLPDLRFKKAPVLLSSGGKLPSEIAQLVQERTSSVVREIYGSTETGGIAWRNSPVEQGWTAFKGIELRIAGDACIGIRSPYLADANWYTTSDCGSLDETGHLYLQGRVDSIVKIEEKRVSLTEVERRLRESPYVAEARVIALEEGRQFLAAVLVLNAAGRAWQSGQTKFALNTHFKNWLRSWFEPTVLPRKWRFVEVLPQDSLGKVAHSALADLFAHKAPSTSNDGIVVDQVEQDGDHVIVDFHVPEGSEWFKGHFPSFALLPGVVQIDWLMHCLRLYVGTKADLKAIPRLKFMKPILPGVPVRLDFTLTRSNGVLSYRYENLAQAAIYSSGKLKLELQ